MFIAKKWLVLLFIVYTILIGLIPFLFMLGFSANEEYTGVVEFQLNECKRIIESLNCDGNSL